MKAVTEFPNFTLNKALATKATMTTDGKTPEEIEASLGETYKYEGEKLKYFVNALEVAGKKTENLRRVIVLKLNEGENAPGNGTQIEDVVYIPEFFVAAKPAAAADKGGKGGPRRNNRDGGDKKGSPWGLSPEEKAAKNKKPAAAPTK